MESKKTYSLPLYHENGVRLELTGLSTDPYATEAGRIFSAQAKVRDRVFAFIKEVGDLWKRHIPESDLLDKSVPLPKTTITLEKSIPTAPPPAAMPPPRSGSPGVPPSSRYQHVMASGGQPPSGGYYKGSYQPPTKPAPRPIAPPPPPPTANFDSLPNAKMGEPYVGRLAGNSTTLFGHPIRIDRVSLPPELGLAFDSVRKEIWGTPQKAGDFKIRVRWSWHAVQIPVGMYDGETTLTVNADPRTLWSQQEPSATLPYPKPHTASQQILVNGGRLIGASHRGRSHAHSATFRDDDFALDYDATSGWSVMAVADGAGSAPLSRQGAKLAVDTFRDTVMAALGADSQLRAAVVRWDESSRTTAYQRCYALFQTAADRAVRAIEAEAQQQKTDVRQYATTLLGAVVLPVRAATGSGWDWFIASFWMGDGAIAAYGPTGKVRLMGTPDGGDYAGQTRFLDRAALIDPNFGKRISVGRFSDLTAVLLMTDGVSDPYFDTVNDLEKGVAWNRLWQELEPVLHSRTPDQALAQWLDFFSQGHHDDRTLAALLLGS